MTTITGNPRTHPDSSASPCLNKSHLTEYVGNTFIPDFRMTIHDFFIQKAEHMLRNTTKSVAAISDTLGYENPETFIRAFKKELHTTPAKYRSLYRGTLS